MTDKTTILADGREALAITATEVRYERLRNLGNYENEKVGVTAQVPEGGDPAATVAACRAFVARELGDEPEKRAEMETLSEAVYSLQRRKQRYDQSLARLEQAFKAAVPMLAAVGITPETRPDLRWDFPKAEGEDDEPPY